MDSLSSSFHRHAQEVLPTTVRVFIFVYLIIGCSHLLLLSDQLALPMTSVAFCTLFVGVGVRYTLDKAFIQRHAEYVLTLFVVLAAVNTLLHLFLTAELKHTTNLIFVLAVGGYLLPRNQIFYPVLALILVSWTVIVGLRFEGGGDFAHFGFEVLLGCLFSAFLQMLRRSQLQQLGEVEESVEQLNLSQQQAAASESLLQSLMDNIPAGIIVRDKQTRVRYVNEEARNLLGLDDAIDGNLSMAESPLHLFDQSGRELSIEELPVSKVIETGESIENEVLGARVRDGTVAWGLVNAFPLDIDGTGESVVVMAFSNITERVKAEVELLQSETRARTILASVIDGVIAVDSRENVTLFNPSAERITGFKEADALGGPLSEVFVFAGESAETGSAPENQLREGFLTTQDGREVALELLVSEVQTDAEEATLWVYTFRDVSEQHRVEQERATLDKMSSIGVLAGGIAHDFNNLLTAIYGNVALAESSMNEPEKAADFLKRSSESIHLATNLTKQLLTFSTGSDPVRDVTDIEKLVREAVRFSLSGSSVVAAYRIDSDLQSVEVDAGQVQQAISNIVLNAKQAMEDVGQLTIILRNLDGFVEVELSDEGPGIPAELLGKIFDPYFTTKTTGTGLGLATTHSIVVKHGGNISVESSDSGTTFHLTFPSTVTELNEHEQSAEVVVPDAGLEVLVMDDEEVVLNTISRLIAHLGHRPTETRDGTEAISAYTRKMQSGRKFDLAIMDLTVAGGMGGTAAAAEILGIDPNAKLVVTSGYSSGAEMARFKELGFCARLEKPFRAADLEKTINEAMK
ncbi:MAG: PAS domain S-box protein [Pseudomonadales bacterium]|nr:PAS domain S-box protein [Pseudomonadales bacterium]MBO6595675.1 PAS domain S-box protein [Pseudomonadales bacterium]MBO6820767.1 PAS domain S-box protein [Pseudomonadales bacterium]